MKKINIALGVLLFLLVASTMFLLTKRKEAVFQSEQMVQTYVETSTEYSYDGLKKKNDELLKKIKEYNENIEYAKEDIEKFNETITEAKNKRNNALKFNELAEMYLSLINGGE